MTYKKVIPCLDIKDGRVVKGVNFVDIKDAADPIEAATYYEQSGADELTFLDINATNENRGIMLEVVKRVADSISIPLTVGGGIKDVTDIRRVLKAGADKISINSAAVRTPSLITEAAKEFGSQKIVIAIDVKKNNEKNIWEVMLNGGRVNTGMDAVEWAIKAEELGAGEILLTSMDKDGTKDGYDLDITKAVAEAVGIPVTASGGAGTMEHFYEALTIGKADAVLAASLFHFRKVEIKELKEYLSKLNIPVKLD